MDVCGSTGGYGSSTSVQYLLRAAISSTKLRKVTGLRR
jgi:hypothetical protein